MKRIPKKGSVFDTFTIFIFVFVSIMVGALCIFLFTSFNDSFQGTTAIDEQTKESSAQYDLSMKKVLDGGIVLWMAILWIGSIISSLYMRVQPAYFVVFFILAIVSFLILVPFANVQHELSTSGLSSAYDNMPMSKFINDNWAIFIVIYLASLGVALYGSQKLT